MTVSKKTQSTDDVNPGKFRPHGRIHFTKEHNVLICEATGPFNRELIGALAELEHSMIGEMLAYEHWADIVVIKENAMASPEDLIAFTEYLTSMGRNNMNSLVTAMVIGDEVIGADIMTHQIVDAYMDAGINLNIFKRLHDAKVFVRLIL
jgi:hypothetical protein